MLVPGLVLGVVGAEMENKTTQTILTVLSVTLFLAAAIQIIVYKSRPKLFDDKES